MKFEIGETVEIKGTGISGKILERGEFKDGVVWYRVQIAAVNDGYVAVAWSEEALVKKADRENTKGFTRWLAEAIDSHAQLDGVQTAVRVQGVEELVVESNGVRFLVSVKTL